jgi:hypothetical protein
LKTKYLRRAKGFARLNKIKIIDVWKSQNIFEKWQNRQEREKKAM